MASKSKIQFPINRSNERYQTAAAAVLELAQNISRPIDSHTSSGFSSLPTNCSSFSIEVNARNLLSSEVTNIDPDVRSSDGRVSFMGSSSSTGLKCDITVPDSTINNSSENSELDTEDALKTAFQSLAVIDAMYQLHEEREMTLEVKNESFRKSLIHRTSEITNSQALLQRLEYVQELSLHFHKIIKEVQLLKQKLRNPSLNEVWNVDISHHRFVLQYLNCMCSLIKNLDKNIDSIQWNDSRDLETSIKMEPYMEAVAKRVVELQQYLDSLSEFRNLVEKMFVFNAVPGYASPD